MNIDKIKDCFGKDAIWAEAQNGDGLMRLIGETPEYNVEIVPDQSVTVSFGTVGEAVVSVIDHFVEDPKMTLDYMLHAMEMFSAETDASYYMNFGMAEIRLEQWVVRDEPQHFLTITCASNVH